MTEGPKTTFVCCIEPGLLEPMTLRLLESIRKHGGRFADARFIACQPRFGPPLSESTRQALRDLNGEHIWLWRPRKMEWYHYLNKPAALLALDERIDTEWVTFLDSDVLIAQEPAALVSSDADFLACAPDDGLVGSTGPQHPMDPTWRRYIAAVGLTLEQVPMIKEHNTGKEIRLYFNSGAFSYRKSTGFANTYWNVMQDVLVMNLGFPSYYEHFTDQVVLGLCALKMHLNWRALPMGYNLAVDRDAEQLSDEHLAAATVLHYHKALERDPEPLFRRLQSTHPEVAAWLTPLGRLEDPRSSLTFAATEVLRIARGLPRALYRRRVSDQLKRAGEIGGQGERDAPASRVGA